MKTCESLKDIDAKNDLPESPRATIGASMQN